MVLILGGHFVSFSGRYGAAMNFSQHDLFYRASFFTGIPIMNITSISYRPTRMGGSLAAALLVAGLQLSLVALPIGSLRAGGENEERNAFAWRNLQSDIAGVADRTDPNLVNSWGLTINTNANVFWIADNGSGVSTLYRPDGSPVLLPTTPPQNFVTIPPTSADKGTPPSAAPTGIVFNASPSAFLFSKPAMPAVFLFDGEDGAIFAWNPGVDLTNAKIVVDNSSPDPKINSVYKGLASANRKSGGPTLYATNFHNGTVDVFDSSFHPVTGGFVDPNLPANYAPFGIATIDNLIYVTFALQNDAKHDDVAGVGHGFIDVFTPEGVLMQRLIPFTPGSGRLNSPWGLAKVPHEFGKFGHDVLLVANFGDGKINAFDIHSGTFIAHLNNRRGEPLDFNGLWALFFLDDRLYFTAGIGDESHGLFGVIRPVEGQGEQDSHK
jgi:uncharacterized protein (TIGR03118 family)